MGSSTHTPLFTEGPRASKFTEVAGHDLTPTSRHGYDCVLDVEVGGDCEHITIDGIDPTFPDTWDLMPMALSSSSVFLASPSEDGEGAFSDSDEEVGWGDSTLQIDSEATRHADAMAKFCTRGRSRGRLQSRRRSWGGVLVFVEALRKRVKVLERRMRRGWGLRAVHDKVVC